MCETPASAERRGGLQNCALVAWLRVVSALSAAAASDNLLFAGSRVQVSLPAGAERELLLRSLELLGAHIEFAAQLDAAGTDTARRIIFVTADAASHPAGLRDTVVGLDGSVRSARQKLAGRLHGTDAAARMAWAAQEMHAVRAGLERLTAEFDVRGVRLLISLVLEPKTAAFARALAQAGFAVSVFSACSETDPAVAAALAAEPGINVFAPQTAAEADAAHAEATDRANAASALATKPQLLIDDGSHLLRLMHTTFPELLDTLWGAAEETTSGVRPLLEMLEQGELRVPVVAVNDVRTKTLFDNRIGTGESCVFALFDVLAKAPSELTRRQLRPGASWLVLGYGPVGEGVCRAAAALGASVTVSEPDAVRALEALHAGFRVAAAESVLAEADVVVSATGVWHTVSEEMLRQARPDTVFAVAGGIDDEIALDAAARAGLQLQEVSPQLAHLTPVGQEGCVPAGALIAAAGFGINYTAGEGNPVEIMDLSFATQLGALRFLLRQRENPAAASPSIQLLSTEEENWVAQAALAARGCTLPAPTADVRVGGARQDWRIHRYRQ